MHRFNLEAQGANYGIHNNGTAGNWTQRMSSPNSAPATPQRINTANGLSITPVQQRMNCRPMSTGSVKKHTWSNTKLNKRHSYQDLPLLRESCNNSDSGFSSRSPTPNKHHKGGSQTESSDERDSLASVSEPTYKYVLQFIQYSNIILNKFIIKT